MLKTSWNYHCPCHPQSSGKDERTNRILKLSLPWPNVLLLIFVCMFFNFLAALSGMWNLSSLTRDQTCVLCNGKWKWKWSRVQLFSTPWTITYQALLSMGSSRQEYWSGLPFPSPGDILDPSSKPGSPTLQADTLPSEPPGKPEMKVQSLNHWTTSELSLVLLTTCSMRLGKCKLYRSSHWYTLFCWSLVISD